MMRRFSSGKKFATLALASAMAASVLAPINAQAASSYVKSLSTSKSSVTVKAGKTVSVTAKVSVSGSASKKVTASSKSKSIATVSVKYSSGKNTVKIKGVKKGSTTVTVKTSGKNKSKKYVSKTIKVKVDYADATKISVSADKTSINVGDRAQLTAKVTPSTAKKTVTWKSSDTSVATVDDKGGVLGVGSGTATITAKSSGSKTGKITITVKSTTVQSVAITDKDGNAMSATSLVVGNSTTLTPVILPEDATDKSYVWTSSEPSVATISQEGVVSALTPGTTVLTVTTNDGGLKATVTLTVTEDSKQDVDGVKMTVSNSLEGYPNTVLVGTNAYISVTATKDGAPYTGIVDFTIDSKKSTGYDQYYELSDQTIRTDEKGNAQILVRLINTKKDMPAVITNDTDDFAYANLSLTATVGGANLSETINVSFAQISTQTENSLIEWDLGDNTAITVENNYEGEYLYELEPIQPNSSWADTIYTHDKDGHYEEYIAEQQRSDKTLPNGNHMVAFDAAPLLIRAAAIGSTVASDYEATVENGAMLEYSVYADEDKYVELKNVPGGLQYVNLTFKKLQLSEYTRVVIQAYEKDTSIPIPGAVMYIDPSTVIKEGSIGGNKFVIDRTVFDITKYFKEFDIRIYIQSYGQVCEDTNIGFELLSAKGPYENTTAEPYEPIRLVDAVKWEVGAKEGYKIPKNLTSAEAKEMLGNYFYHENGVYDITYPTFPENGNAIITEVLDGKTTYYMIPTENPYTYVDGEKVYVNDNQVLNNPSQYVFKASVQQVQELTADKFIQEVADGRLYLNSEYAGYNVVYATVDAFGKAKYTVSSSVTWAPIPAETTEVVEDFYALTGQKVTLTATVLDSNNQVVPEVPVTFETIDGTTLDQTVTTDSNGVAQYVISNVTEAKEYKKVAATIRGKYTVKLKIGNQDVTDDAYANIHWVTPGLYYKANETAPEYITSSPEAMANTDAAIKVDATRYVAGSTWIVGTKVVGTIAKDDDGKDVTGISNIKIDYSQNSTSGLSVTKTDVSNGVVTITTTGIGDYDLIAQIAGILAPTEQIVITLEDDTSYISVGEGAPNPGKDLDLQVKWAVSDAKLSIVNVDKTYDINQAFADGKIEDYIKVVDQYGNPVVDSEVDYIITDADNNTIAEEKKVKTNANGIITVAINVPKKASTYTLSANFTGSSLVEKAIIKFVENGAGSNALTLAADPAIDAAGTVTLTFTQQMDAAAALAGFYTVTDQTGNKFDVTGVAVNPDNNKQIIITVNTQNGSTTGLSSSAIVTIKNTFKDGDITYLLTDKLGNLFQNN